MKKKQRNWKLITFNIIRLGFLFVLIYLIIAASIQSAKAASFNYLTRPNDVDSTPPLTVLLGASDTGGYRTADTDGLRTDTLMIATFTPTNIRGNIEVNFVSIPRDTKVPITCLDGSEDKINSASANGYIQDGNKGAADCTVDTVEQLFGINIDYYAFADFDSFRGLVDELDGITINVPYEFCEQDANGEADAICFEEGEQVLDGEQALAYARQRYQSSDYERAQRQQEIISKMVYKVINDPAKYADKFALSFISNTNNNFNIDLVTTYINYAANTFNLAAQKLADGTPLLLDLKTSDLSMVTGFNPIANATGLDKNATELTPSETYSTFATYEENYQIQRYMFTKDTLNLPSIVLEDSDKKPLILEVQFLTLAVTDDSSGGIYYSIPVPDSLAYISNLLRQGVNSELLSEDQLEYVTPVEQAEEIIYE